MSKIQIEEAALFGGGIKVICETKQHYNEVLLCCRDVQITILICSFSENKNCDESYSSFHICHVVQLSYETWERDYFSQWFQSDQSEGLKCGWQDRKEEEQTYINKPDYTFGF